MNTVLAGLPHLPRWGSVIVTGSLAVLLKGGVGANPGGAAYTLTKRTLIPFVQSTAVAVAEARTAASGTALALDCGVQK
jgi:hypothetical protein